MAAPPTPTTCAVALISCPSTSDSWTPSRLSDQSCTGLSPLDPGLLRWERPCLASPSGFPAGLPELRRRSARSTLELAPVATSAVLGQGRCPARRLVAEAGGRRRARARRRQGRARVAHISGPGRRGSRSSRSITARQVQVAPGSSASVWNSYRSPSPVSGSRPITAPSVLARSAAPKVVSADVGRDLSAQSGDVDWFEQPPGRGSAICDRWRRRRFHT